MTSRLRGLASRFWDQRPLLTTAFALFVLINIVLLAGYFWSRGGQTLQVRVVARGSEFTAYVDGKLTASGEFEAAEQGGIVLILGSTVDVPSLPSPRGIDSVRVTDLTSGEVLFEDDFSSGYDDAWTVLPPEASISEGGVLGARQSMRISLPDRPWTDYAVDVAYKNIVGAEVIVRAQDSGAGLSYALRPFRHFDNSFRLFEGGERLASEPGGRIELSRTETIKSLVAMTLRPYPLVLAVMSLGFVAVAGLQYADRIRLPIRLPRATPDLPWLLLGGLVGAVFTTTLYLNYVVGSHMPHVPDSVSYMFQAKLLASGRLWAQPPPVQDAFDFFHPPFIILAGDKWVSIYPFGHPLALALGTRIGAVWLIPPLLGSASVALLFLIGRRIYATRVGLPAALLLATSPFFLMTASNFMGHNTAAFYLLASLAFLAFIDKRPVLFGVLAGIFFGLLFNTRPLTAVALIPPFGVYLLTLALPSERRAQGAKQIGAFVAGGLVMFGAFLLYNLGTSGEALTSGYGATNALYGESGVVGFGGRNTPEIGIQNEQTQMAYLLLVLNGWPQYVGLAFVLLPFILATRSKWDWFLLTSAVMMMAAYAFFAGSGIMHGPRYWYEAAPLLMLLAARGADRAADLLASGASWLRGALSGGGDGGKGIGARHPIWAGRLIVFGLVAALAGGSVYGWLLGNETSWRASFVPSTAGDLDGFNFMGDELLTLVDEAHLENALVLVKPCPGWWCYGNVFWRNSPDLDGNVVYAKDLPERRADLFRAYPDRTVYAATYQPRGRATLAPFTLAPDVPTNDPAPVAKDIILPTPTAVPPPPTPNALDELRRDAQRRQDLATIAGALQTYYGRHASYPVTEVVQSFCLYPDLDVGCKVAEVLDPIPKEPSGSTYLYVSNGESFTLFAAMEVLPDTSQCLQDLPEVRIPEERLYCVHGIPPATP